MGRSSLMAGVQVSGLYSIPETLLKNSCMYVVVSKSLSEGHSWLPPWFFTTSTCAPVSQSVYLCIVYLPFTSTVLGPVLQSLLEPQAAKSFGMDGKPATGSLCQGTH